MILNKKRTHSKRLGVSKLSLALLIFIIILSGFSAYIYVKAQAKNLEIEELFSFERIKGLFIDHRPIITPQETEKLKNIIGAGGNESEVPASASEKSGEAAPAPKGNVDEIVLRNGDVITGDITNEKITLKTEHGDISFKSADISAIYSVYETDKPYDKLISKNGDRVSGRITADFISLKTPGGDAIQISFSKIKIINKRK